MVSSIRQSKTTTNDYYYLKNEGRNQGSSNNVLLFMIVFVKAEDREYSNVFCIDAN